MCAGVVEDATVDGEVIVVETRIHRTLCRSYPYTILILAQYSTATTTKTQTYNHGLSIGSLYAEAGKTFAVHLRILLSRLVHGVGYPVIFRYIVVAGNIEVADDSQ